MQQWNAWWYRMFRDPTRKAPKSGSCHRHTEDEEEPSRAPGVRLPDSTGGGAPLSNTVLIMCIRNGNFPVQPLLLSFSQCLSFPGISKPSRDERQLRSKKKDAVCVLKIHHLQYKHFLSEGLIVLQLRFIKLLLKHRNRCCYRIGRSWIAEFNQSVNLFHWKIENKVGTLVVIFTA